MHTITECPWCGKDFMYHRSDTYLIRQLTLLDEVGNNEIIDLRDKAKKELFIYLPFIIGLSLVLQTIIILTLIK